MMEKEATKHFVLVHGVCGGGWCWYKIRTLLENSGCKVTCLDLKGAGVDASNSEAIFSFEEYNQPLIQFLLDLPDDEKVILVGHSAGGLNVTDAIHKFARKIEVAVYVGATMLMHGFSTPQDIKEGVPDLSEYGEIEEYAYGLGHDKSPTSVTFKKEFLRTIFYHMSPQEDCTLASMLLRPGPIRALRGAQFAEGSGAEQVRRVYIKTTHDRVLKLEQQDAMIKRWPPSHVFALESDHSPNFSAPVALFNILVKVNVLA